MPGGTTPEQGRLRRLFLLSVARTAHPFRGGFIDLIRAYGERAVRTAFASDLSAGRTAHREMRCRAGRDQRLEGIR